MHIFAEPSPIIREAARLIRPGGVFAFCCMDGDRGENISIKHCGHQVHGHSREFIGRVLTACGMELYRTLSFVVDMHRREQDFRAYIAGKP